MSLPMHAETKSSSNTRAPGRGARGQWPAGARPRRPPTCRRSLRRVQPRGAARSQRARRGAPLHAALAAQLLHRHAFLSARLVHDEVQPAGLQPATRCCRSSSARHPLAPDRHGQGFLACMYELQEMLKEVTGMRGRGADADGRRAWRVRRRRDDPRLSPRARRSRAQRDHRARRRARHQPGHRHDVRLHGARDPDRATTATSTSRR